MKAPLCFTPVEFIHNSAWDAPAASVFTEEDGAVMLRVRANLFSLWNSVPPPPDPRTRALCHLSATPPLPPHAPLTSVWSDVRYQAMSQGALPNCTPPIAIHTGDIVLHDLCACGGCLFTYTVICCIASDGRCGSRGCAAAVPTSPQRRPHFSVLLPHNLCGELSGTGSYPPRTALPALSCVGITPKLHRGAVYLRTKPCRAFVFSYT